MWAEQRTDRASCGVFGCVSAAISGNPRSCARLTRGAGGAGHKILVICLTEHVSTCNSGVAAEFRADLRCLGGMPTVIIL